MVRSTDVSKFTSSRHGVRWVYQGGHSGTRSAKAAPGSREIRRPLREPSTGPMPLAPLLTDVSCLAAAGGWVATRVFLTSLVAAKNSIREASSTLFITIPTMAPKSKKADKGMTACASGSRLEMANFFRRRRCAQGGEKGALERC